MNTSSVIELSIVMPCLNEIETIEICIKKAQTFLRENNVKGEILIGDNGSTDGSIEKAESLGARVIHIKERGYGVAIHGAVLASHGQYIIMGDSDDSYDFLNLMPFVSELRTGADLVMGNRFRGGIKPGAMPWKNRYIGNPVLSLIGRLFFNSTSKDFHCGLRGFSRIAFNKMDLRTKGMEYASEIVIKSTLKKLIIKEVPTTLSPDGRNRKPHLRPWRDGWRHLRFMFLYSPKSLFYYPGLFLCLVGIFLTGSILVSPLYLMGIRFDIHTMLFSSSFIVVGYQSISFAIFTKIFASNFGLLPQSKRLNFYLDRFEIEYGIIFGFLTCISGLGLALRAFSIWKETSFSTLVGTFTIKLSIISVLLLTIGMQTFINSFYLGVLGLKTRPKVLL